MRFISCELRLKVKVKKMEKSKPRKSQKAQIKKGVAEEFGSIDTKSKVYKEPENRYTKQLEEKRVKKRLRDKDKVKDKPHLNKKEVARRSSLKQMGLSGIEEEEFEEMYAEEELDEETDDIEEEDSPLMKEVEGELKYKLD